MSTGNGGAAIGLANTFKRAHIGATVLTTPALAGVDYLGTNGTTYWDRNWLQEDPGFSLISNVPAKNAVWATNPASLTVPADRRLSVTAGGIATASAGTGLFLTALAAGTVIPANSWFWTGQF